MQLIDKYFPNLSPTQRQQFEQLGDLYPDWNNKINVISRKDIHNLYERHILHSMSIAKVIQFKEGSRVMDLGTGGGFPGIPLAILFPETRFFLADSIRKKIRVTQAVAETIGLDNVHAEQIRVEEIKLKFDFVVTRAVAPMPKLFAWCRKSIGKKHRNALPNGFLALKGIDRAREEAKALGKNIHTKIYPLSDWFEEPFFETKCLIYAQK